MFPQKLVKQILKLSVCCRYKAPKRVNQCAFSGLRRRRFVEASRGAGEGDSERRLGFDGSIGRLGSSCCNGEDFFSFFM